MTHTFLKTALLSAMILTGHLSGAQAARAGDADLTDLAATRRIERPVSDIIADALANKAGSGSFSLTAQQKELLNSPEGTTAVENLIKDYNAEAAAHNYDLTWTSKNDRFSELRPKEPNGAYAASVIGWTAAREMEKNQH